MSRNVHEDLARRWLSKVPNPWKRRTRDISHELILIGLAALVGMGTGVVTALFRRALEFLGEHRLRLAHWAQQNLLLGLPLHLGISVAGAAFAAWLVHRVEPHTEGSGIPRVEGIVAGRIPPGRRRILPVKFLGGLASIGSGLVLGREGPSVQMGATVATGVAALSRRPDADMRTLVAAGAGAGLTTAFAAPIAGSIFILEELLKKFDHRVGLAALVATGSGYAVSRLILGPGTEFVVPALDDPHLRHLPVVLLVGIVTGLVGVLYNRVIIGFLRQADVSHIPVVVRAALIGLVVGVAGLLAPHLMGGGHDLTQAALLGQGTLLAVTLMLVARFFLGALSYAACTPGGLFAPTLVLGANVGLVVGLIGRQVAPHLVPEPAALALIGMASLFAATVRAPVTGIVLAMEMSGSAVLLAPMLGASAAAMFIALVMRCDPIYDQLTERSVWRTRANVARGTTTGSRQRE